MKLRLANGRPAYVGGVLLALLFAAAPAHAEPCKHGWPDETCSVVTPGKDASAARKAKVRGWVARRQAARENRHQTYTASRRARPAPSWWYWPF
jgi:hypothetical protein